MFQYSTAKSEELASKTFDLTVDHEAQICGQTVSVSQSSGNLMINLAWEILSGNDAGKKIRNDRIVLSSGSLFRLDQFMAAIDLDPAKEFGGQTVDQAFLTRWAEKLLGETALLTLKMSKPTAEYPEARVEVKAYKPVGSAVSATSTIDLD